MFVDLALAVAFVEDCGAVGQALALQAAVCGVAVAGDVGRFGAVGEFEGDGLDGGLAAFVVADALGLHRIVDFDQAAATHYGSIRAAVEAKGVPIGAMDMLIAAQARSKGLALVTNNVREFRRVEGLQVENWVAG